MNKKALEGLPSDLQAIVEGAARYANQDMLDEYTARNSEALEKMIREHKVEVRMFPSDVLAEFKRLSEEVLKGERDRSPLAQKIFASFDQFRRRTRAYYRVAEDAYDKAR